ncbi:MAG: hypothetical protein JOZ63_10390 [Planctomycetaceae bacterium]|nr:hypothetical protein [Planctomycetaceae bacterium]
MTQGFAAESWTGPRLAQLILQAFDIRLNPRDLCSGIWARGFTPRHPSGLLGSATSRRRPRD